MLLAEGPGLQEQGLRGVRTGGRPMISGRGYVAAVVPGEPEQVIDGASGEAEALSQGLSGRAALAGSEQGLPDR